MQRSWLCERRECAALKTFEEIEFCQGLRVLGQLSDCPLVHVLQQAQRQKPGANVLDLPTLKGKIEEAERALQQEAAKAVRIVQANEKSALVFCHRLIAIARVVLDEKKSSLPNRGWRVIVVSLAAKVISTVRASLTLAAAGHAHEVDILVRSALEALITALFIAQRQSARRAKRWAQYAVLQKARVLKKYPNLSSKPEHKTARAKILAHERKLKKLFPNPGFWASGLHKGGLRDLAEDVGMGWYYDMPYWSGSQSTHGSAIAVDRHLSVGSDGMPSYKVGLSSQHLRGELAVCCDLLVRTLVLLNKMCKLELKKVCADLTAEYKAAFGGDPLEEIASGD